VDAPQIPSCPASARLLISDDRPLASLDSAAIHPDDKPCTGRTRPHVVGQRRPWCFSGHLRCSVCPRPRERPPFSPVGGHAWRPDREIAHMKLGLVRAPPPLKIDRLVCYMPPMPGVRQSRQPPPSRCKVAAVANPASRQHSQSEGCLSFPCSQTLTGAICS
jgi:hypothetical protein